MSELSHWLEVHGLSQWRDLLAGNSVDLAALMIMTEGDFEELGMPFGPRKRFLAALKATKPQPPSGAAEEERRQLTVLFCDIVDYTSLASRVDPEILARHVLGYEDLCAACVSRYEGYVFQRLGDGIVAFFGYPLAHEREAERAIRAAIDILDSAKSRQEPFKLRIGIATGIVVVASGGRTAVGDTMNLAARLQAAAEPGTILVGPLVKNLAASAFHYHPLGDMTLKGFAKPVPVFRVEGPQQTQPDKTSAEGIPPVGREEELNLLNAEWQRVNEEGRGRIAGIGGEAGIGKSRLAASLCAGIVTPENRFIRFQCSPFHTNTSLYPVIAHLESLLAFDRGMEAEERLLRIEQLVCGRHGLAAPDVRFVAALLSVPFAHRFGEIAEPPRLAKAETMRILIAMIASAAAGAPAVMLFEDLHWADATTREALDQLASRLVDIPVFVVATYRPDFTPRWAGSAGCSQLALPRLSAGQSHAMIARCTGGKTLPARLEALITEKTDGVPLFIEELTRALLESGQLVEAGGRYVQAGGSLSVRLPDTLRDSLMSRLDRLVKARRVAQLGAVVGRSFSREFVTAMGTLDETALDEGLAQLVDSGLAIAQAGGGANRTYVFKHALVQDAAYDSLLLSQRRSLHNRVADLLTEQDASLTERQPELIAHHLSAAGADAKAVPLWLKAAEIAMQRFAVSEAASHLRNGLSRIEAIPPGRERDVLELRYRAALGPALVAERGWGHPELSAVLEPAWTLASSLRHTAGYLPILNALWVHYMCTDKLDLSLRWAERMLQLGEATGDGDLTIVGHRALSGSAYWQGRFALARSHGDQLQALYDPEKHWHVVQHTNTDPLTGEAIYRGQYLWMLGYPDQAVAASDARDAHARRRGHPFDQAFSLTLGAQLFDFLGLPGELERRAEEAAAMSRRYGMSLFFEVMGEISRGVAWLRAGRNAEAEVQIDRGVTRLASTGHRIWIAYLQALRGEALALMGRYDEARHIMSASIAQIEQGEERSHYAEVLRLRGWLAAREGMHDGAEQVFRRAIEVAQAQQARSWELRSTLSLASLLDGQGRTAEAHRMLADIYQWFTEGFGTKDLAAAAVLLGQLEAKASAPAQTPSLRRTAT